MSEPAESSELNQLIAAMKAQTEAISRLANSNAALVAAIGQLIDDGEPDSIQTTQYLSGKSA